MTASIYKNGMHGDYNHENHHGNSVIATAANAVLERYSLAGARLVSLESACEERTTYRVEMTSCTGAVHPYLGRLARHTLLLHISGQGSLASIGAELSQLAALLRNTELVAPEPVPADDGSLVVTISNTNCPNCPAMHCVLMRTTAERPSELSLFAALCMAS